MRIPVSLVLVLVTCLAWPVVVDAQSHKGDLTISLGIASGNGQGNDLFTGTNSGAGTVPLSVEYRFSRLFSAGPYTSWTYTWYESNASPPTFTDVWKGWDFGLRGTFHASPLFMRFDKLDLYVTAFLGYNSMQAVYDKNNIYRDSLNHRVDAFSAGPIIGAKFYFNRHLGIYAEAGLARVAFIGAGLTWNIRTN